MGLNWLYSLAGVGGGPGRAKVLNVTISEVSWPGPWPSPPSTVEFYSEECGQQTCNQCWTMLYNNWSLTEEPARAFTFNLIEIL